MREPPEDEASPRWRGEITSAEYDQESDRVTLRAEHGPTERFPEGREFTMRMGSALGLHGHLEPEAMEQLAGALEGAPIRDRRRYPENTPPAGGP